MPSEPEDSAFLDARPPHWVARLLASLLIVGFFGGVVMLALIRLPETVDCEFTITPVGGSDPIIVRADALVTRLLVKEGDRVKQGEVLLTLDADDATDKSARLTTLERQIAGLAEQALSARAAFDLRTQADDKELSALKIRIDSLAAELRDRETLAAVEKVKQETSRQLLENRRATVTNDIVFQRQRLDLATDFAKRYRVLRDEGIISVVQMEGYELELNRSKVELDRLNRQAESLTLELKKLENESAEREGLRGLEDRKLAAERRQWQADHGRLLEKTRASRAEADEAQRQFAQQRATLRIEADALGRSLRETRGGEVLVKAPQDGTVVHLGVNAIGAFVRAGAELCRLAEPDAEMMAEITLPESGLGKIRTDQPVKLLYDAFPYQRYGVQHGRLEWVSPARVREGDQPAFQGRVALDRQHIPVKGKSFKVAAGMRGRARIVTEHRSILARLLEPIRAVRENMGAGES